MLAIAHEALDQSGPDAAQGIQGGGQHEVPAERLVPLLTTIVGARR